MSQDSTNSVWTGAIFRLIFVLLALGVFTIILTSVGIVVTRFVTLPALAPTIIFTVFVLFQVAVHTLDWWTTQNTTLKDCIGLNIQPFEVSDAASPDDVMTVVTVTVNTPHNVRIEQPLTVAPTDANPQDWFFSQLTEDTDVTFVMNTEHIPEVQDKTKIVYTPNKPFGPLNAEFTDDTDSLTVYDAELNKIVTYELTHTGDFIEVQETLY